MKCLLRITISGNTSGCNSVTEVENACSALLPVTWIDQPRVYEENGNNIIEWEIASQINNEKFEVEYRLENGLFVKLGELDGHGTTSTGKKYTFVHYAPSRGVNYYRVKQIDYDGNFSYSHIASIETIQDHAISFYPNPVSTSLTIQAKNRTAYTLLSSTNQQLETGVLYPGENKIDFSSFGSGMYYMQVEGNVYKIVKM